MNLKITLEPHGVVSWAACSPVGCILCGPQLRHASLAFRVSASIAAESHYFQIDNSKTLQQSWLIIEKYVCMCVRVYAACAHMYVVNGQSIECSEHEMQILNLAMVDLPRMCFLIISAQSDNPGMRHDQEVPENETTV